MTRTAYYKERYLHNTHGIGASSTVRNAVAHMILEIEELDRLFKVAVEYLAQELDADRVDIGLGNPAHNTWEAQVDYISGRSSPPSTVGVPLPNKHNCLQQIWHSASPVHYQFVATDSRFDGLHEGLRSLECSSMLVTSVRNGDQPLALVCVDDTKNERHWSDQQIQFLSSFCEQYLGPIVADCLLLNHSVQKPTPAELEAVRLASEGLSYKQIAYELGKSIRTIEAQLRSARGKLNAKNQVELINRAERWLS